jgi:eukaryotic-like serine/threonine-protein kinase
MPESRPARSHLVRFGAFEVDLRSGELRRSGVRLPLQEQPFRVLARLIGHPGEVVTREELREELWPADTHVDFEQGLNAAVRRLRETLGDSAETPRFIETMPRRGYRFVAPVQGTPTDLQQPRQPAFRRRHVGGPITLVGALVAAISVSVLWIGGTPPLSERDRILLSDFANRTGDPVFDHALGHALAVKLEESPFLAVVAEERVRETLRLMNRSADERIPPSVGREICVRLGVKAMITGEIGQLGDRYAVGLTAVDCATGDVIARARGEALRKEAVLDTLGRAGATLRRNLGERLSSIQGLDKPLSEATTASLAALEAFSLGEEQRRRGRTAEVIPFYMRAIELDPDFALAYARLSLVHSNMDQFTRAAEYAARAFEHVDRVSERERLYILEAYHAHVSFDTDRRRDIIELWVRSYPRDGRAVQRLALHHIARGECEQGLEHALEQMRLQPDAFAYGTLAIAYECLGRFEEAQAVAERAVEESVDLPHLRILLYRIAAAQGDVDAMQRQVRWAAGRSSEHLMRREEAHRAAARGQLSQARVLLQDAIALAQADGSRQNAGTIAAGAALLEAITGHQELARERAAEALSISRDETTLLSAALALGLAQGAHAETLIEGLPSGHYPVLPVPWAAAAGELGRRRPGRALAVLRAAARYEPVQGSPFSQYLRGEAHLQLGAASDAAREFEKLVDGPGGPVGVPFSRHNWKPLLGVVAHARLGHAYALAGEAEQARASYARFLELWKDADPDVALLRTAQAEYAALALP